MEEGFFDEESQQKIKEHWTIINPIVKELPDVIGEFSWSENQFPAVRRELKEAIEVADPELCSFVPVPRLYDLRHDRVIAEPQYFFAAIRQQKDSIDMDAGETGTVAFADGRTQVELLPKSRIRPSVLEGAMLWRDTQSKHVLCNEAFRAVAEAAGCVGFYFLEVKLAE